MRKTDIENLRVMLVNLVNDLDNSPSIDKINFNIGLAADYVKNLTVYEHNCEFSAMLRKIKVRK